MSRLGTPLLSFLLFRLPGRIRGKLAKRLWGWEIHPSARVGLSLIDAKYVSLGSGVVIGHFTIIRDLSEFSLGPNSFIGQWNWISAAQSLVSHFGAPAGVFHLGEGSVLTSRHYVDVSGGVYIGDFSIIGGVGSTILSHEVEFSSSAQTIDKVQIGDYCFISSNCRIVAGSTVGSYVVVAMGAVIAGGLDKEYSLYAGVPARRIKDLGEADYFSRKEGWIGPARGFSGGMDEE